MHEPDALQRHRDSAPVFYIREMGTELYWDGVCFGEFRRAKSYPSIMAALAVPCGATITEVVPESHFDPAHGWDSV